MAVTNPAHLIEQAERLAAPPGVGAPRQADLKRAISSAYYAVFHAVVAAVADDIVGKTQRHTPRYELVYRSVEHRSIHRVCEEIAKSKLPIRYVRYEPPGGFGSDLISVATAFLELEEKRHAADYDPLYRASVSDAMSAIATGRTALTRLENANRARRKIFLSLMAFTPR